MPDSSNPISPNFIPGVGRLVTDRFDFQAHVDGANFRHTADQIDVIPNILINSVECTNVMVALRAIASNLSPPTVPLATNSTAGIIRLNNDLGGTNGLSPKVIGLQGFPLSSQTPIVNNVLTWNGSAWIPQTLTGLFIAGADLGGNSPVSSNSLQYVSNLSGSFGTVSITANDLVFSSSAIPNINQSFINSGTGQNFNISAQSINGSGIGGTLILQGGNVISGLSGGTLINIGGNAALQIAQVTTGNNVVALFPNGGLSSTLMPSGTGNGVIYISNAISNPTTGIPVSGAILYGNNGQLWVKQSDSTTFQIGSIPSPSIWNGIFSNSLPSNPSIPTNGTISYNTYIASSTSSPINAIVFAMPVNTSINMHTTYVAKEVGTGNSAQYNYNIGFSRNGSGAPSAIGTVTSIDARTTGGSWVAPTTTLPSGYISGNNIIISTGYSTAASAVWTITTQITITTA